MLLLHMQIMRYFNKICDKTIYHPKKKTELYSFTKNILYTTINVIKQYISDEFLTSRNRVLTIIIWYYFKLGIYWHVKKSAPLSKWINCLFGLESQFCLNKHLHRKLVILSSHQNVFFLLTICTDKFYFLWLKAICQTFDWSRLFS